jgi:hypothetical protein
MTGAGTLTRRRLVLVAVAVLLLGAGVLLARLHQPASQDKRPEAAAPDPERPSPSAEDPDRAVATALAITVASQAWLYLTDDQLGDAVAGLATPAARDRLVDRIVGEVRLVREHLSDATGRIWWVVRPLAWRVERSTRDTARIEVWTVGVLSASGVAAPQAEWSTLIFDLVRTDDGWRLDDLRDQPGPTPMTGPADDPWNAERFDQGLDGFTRLGEEVTQ